MLPGDMNLNIRSGTVGYKSKILVSNKNFSLGENDKVNTLKLAKGGGDKPKKSKGISKVCTISFERLEASS